MVDEVLKVSDKNTYFLTGDLGFGVLEPIRDKLGERFINIGVAEQSLIGVAAGLALSGKKVFTYTISTFYLRALEQIKLDLCYQQLNVIMLGAGTQFDYEYLGTTHFAIDDDRVTNQLLNIEVVTPKNQSELRDEIRKRNKSRPKYIRIGGYKENMDFDIDWNKLKEYPHEAGARQYFKLKYGKNEN